MRRTRAGPERWGGDGYETGRSLQRELCRFLGKLQGVKLGLVLRSLRKLTSGLDRIR